jgi:hypothetical protein
VAKLVAWFFERHAFLVKIVEKNRNSKRVLVIFAAFVAQRELTAAESVNSTRQPGDSP